MSEQKRLEKMFKNGKILRRNFVAGMSALGISAALSPLILPRSVQAAVPKKGGRFRIGFALGTTAMSLDTTLMNSGEEYFINYLGRNNLIEVDYKGNAVPELAESWEFSSDFSTWVFNLRKGVEFHNGKTLTAEDVIYSFNLHRGETHLCKCFAQCSRQFKRIMRSFS